MIHYLVTAAHAYTMKAYLATWGRCVSPRIRVLSYRTLSRLHELPAGTYVFSDLDRLTEPEKALATTVWNQLARAGPCVRTLNNPQLALTRYELLRALNEKEANRFQAYRLGEQQAARFPVFLRRESEHTGRMTGLLRDPDDLDRAISRVRRRGWPLSDTLVVEYCDTRDEAGIIRKYAAFFIGGQVIPRHLMFSRKWAIHKPDLLDADKVLEEREYLDENPHQGWIRRVFRIARIDYGRIDYAVNGNRPQVWEVNTNPIVMFSPERYQAARLPAQSVFSERIAEAFESIDLDDHNAVKIPIAVPSVLRLRSNLAGILRSMTRRFGRVKKLRRNTVRYASRTVHRS